MTRMARWLSLKVFFIIFSACIQQGIAQCPSTTVQLDAYVNTVTTFTSEDFPNGYPSLQGCSWLITASGANRVLLFLPQFYLEENYDFLYIYDGNSTLSPSLWVGTGLHTNEFFLSSSDTMYLSFFSDYSVSRTGFKIHTVATDRDNVAAPYSCGDTLTAFSGNYSQLSVILDYDSAHRSACAYTITSGAGTNIQFSLQIDKRGGIVVYDGSNSSVSSIVSYSGNGDTSIHQSSGNYIYVQKTSRYAEFVLVYQEVATSVTTPTAATTTTTVAPSAVCSASQLTATSTTDILESPGYPNAYPNNMYCVTVIEAADPTQSVIVTMVDEELQFDVDVLEIYDGYSIEYPMVWRSNGTLTQKISSGSALTIRFFSDSSAAYRGFLLEYQQIARALPYCVPYNTTILSATTSQQTFSSRNYPSNYDNYDAQYWLIEKTAINAYVTLEILDIHMEYSLSCVYDRLTFYDGPCVDSPVLASVCGKEDPVIQDSTGLYILVEFITDGSVTYRGWEISYRMGSYDDDGAEDTWWIIPVIAVIVVIIILLFFAIVFICNRYKRWQASKHRVTPTSKKDIMMISNAPAATHSAKRLTTSELLAELQARYGHRGMNKKPKVSRKHQEAYGVGEELERHPAPAPPFGVSQNGGVARDPAYPPNFFGISASEVTTNAPMPNMAPQSQLPPLGRPPSTPMETRSIPGPSRYVTPAEARAGGTISDPREIRKVVEMTR